jgi:predicted transcriptional regulator
MERNELTSYATRIRAPRRDPLSLLLDTLEIISSGDGIAPTTIMWSLRTNYKVTCQRVNDLIDRCLVEATIIVSERDKRRFVGYSLTDKGRRAIRLWNELSELLAR